MGIWGLAKEPHQIYFDPVKKVQWIADSNNNVIKHVRSPPLSLAIPRSIPLATIRERPNTAKHEPTFTPSLPQFLNHASLAGAVRTR